jgi:hypothetical protein
MFVCRLQVFCLFPVGYSLKAGPIRRDKKKLRSFLSRFALVAFSVFVLVDRCNNVPGGV